MPAFLRPAFSARANCSMWPYIEYYPRSMISFRHRVRRVEMEGKLYKRSRGAVTGLMAGYRAIARHTNTIATLGGAILEVVREETCFSGWDCLCGRRIDRSLDFRVIEGWDPGTRREGGFYICVPPPAPGRFTSPPLRDPPPYRAYPGLPYLHTPVFSLTTPLPKPY